jgi:methionyl-tRNA formyltransferase
VVFATRAGATGEYLAHVLAQEKALQALVVETGAAARKRKLRRTFGGASIGLLGRFVDVAAIVALDRLGERRLRADVLEPHRIAGWPSAPTITVTDANDVACRAFLTDATPDVLVVCGTAILREDILNIPRRYALNVHGAMVPAYRNVHGTFWATVQDDDENLGSSILHLTSGIDNGDIAAQRRLEDPEPRTLRAVRRETLLLSGELLREAIALARTDDVPRKPQEGKVGVWHTPRAIDIVRHARRVLS